MEDEHMFRWPAMETLFSDYFVSFLAFSVFECPWCQNCLLQCQNSVPQCQNSVLQCQPSALYCENSVKIVSLSVLFVSFGAAT